MASPAWDFSNLQPTQNWNLSQADPLFAPPAVPGTQPTTNTNLKQTDPAFGGLNTGNGGYNSGNLPTTRNQGNLLQAQVLASQGAFNSPPPPTQSAAQSQNDTRQAELAQLTAQYMSQQQQQNSQPASTQPPPSAVGAPASPAPTSGQSQPTNANDWVNWNWQDFGNEDMDFLRSLVQGERGSAFDAQPVWDAMVQAQQRNVDQNAAQLNEYFNVMGGRFSSSFGDAMGQFYDQTTKDQNSLLGQMQMQSFEQAMARMYGGASNIAGMTHEQNLAKNSAELQKAIAGGQMGLTASEGAANRSNAYGIAGMQTAAQRDIASLNASTQQSIAAQDAAVRKAIAEMGDSTNRFVAQGGWNTQKLLQDNLLDYNRWSNQGDWDNRQAIAEGSWANDANLQNQKLDWQTASQLSLQEHQWGMNNENNQYGLIPSFLNYNLGVDNNAINAALAQSQINNTHVRLGMDLGMTEWDVTQNGINAQFAEWLRTLPANDPILAAIAGAANSNQTLMFPQHPGIQFPGGMF